MQFYSVAAQVIPVLFLALLVERRFFEPAQEAIDPLADLLVILIFVAAETLALWALAGGRPGRASLALVATAFALGGLALIAPIAGPRFTRLYGEAGSHRLPRIVDRATHHVMVAALYGVPLGFVVALWVRAFV